MKREFKGIQRKGLPGGPHEQFTYVTGVFMQDMYHVPKAQKGITVESEDDPRYQSYADSAALYNAMIMQDKLMGDIEKPNRNDTTWAKKDKIEGRTRKPYTFSDGTIVRDKDGTPIYRKPDFGTKHEMFGPNLDQFNEIIRPEDLELINYYQSLGFTDDDIMYHGSPDIVSDKIKAIGTFYDGTAYSPIYPRPKYPVFVKGKKPIELLDNKNAHLGKITLQPDYRVVDYMNMEGMDSSFDTRSKWAQMFGIENYKGTEEQNLELLERLKEYKKNPIRAQRGGEGYRLGEEGYNDPYKIIPSGNITMTEKDGSPLKKGPMLGIDDLGNQQMMYPGYDYKFPGSKVTEIPMAQSGKMIKNVFDQYPGLYDVASPKDYKVSKARGKHLEHLEGTGRGLEYFAPGDTWYPFQDSEDVKLNIPGARGKHRIVYNPYLENPEEAIKLDIISHSYNTPESKAFKADLDTKLREKYGDQMVDANGGVDAYIRGYLSNLEEYSPYKKEMEFLPEGYFDSFMQGLTKKQEGGIPEVQRSSTRVANIPMFTADEIAKAEANKKRISNNPYSIIPEAATDFAYEYTGIPALQRMAKDPAKYKAALKTFMSDLAKSSALAGSTMGPRPIDPETREVLQPEGGYANEVMDMSVIGSYIPMIAGMRTLSKAPTSTIKWANWNKNTPKNKALLDEYKQIEKRTKADGTWMKNPDGTPFVGSKPTQKQLDDLGINMTPKEAVEAQFVQQQSKSFKEAFDDSFFGKGFFDEETTFNIDPRTYFYHGSPRSAGNFSAFDQPGTGNWFSNSADYSDYFVANWKRKENPIVRPFYLASDNVVLPDDFMKMNKGNMMFEDAMSALDPVQAQRLKDLGIINKTSYRNAEDLVGFEDTEWLVDRFYDLEDNFINLTPDQKQEYELLNKMLKDEPKNFIKKNNYGVKSALGNVGTFDLSTDNIFKSLLPAGVAAEAINQNIKEDKNLPEYQQAGEVLTYENNPEYFDNRAALHENLAYSDLVRSKVYAGTHGFNPQSGELIKLDKAGRPADELTTAYSKREEDRSSEEETLIERQGSRNRAFQDLQALYRNPVFYAPAAVAGVGTLGPAAMTAMSNPLVSGPLSAYGVYDAANYSIPGAVSAYDEGRYLDMAGNVGMASLDLLPIPFLGTNLIRETRDFGRAMTTPLAPSLRNIGSFPDVLPNEPVGLRLPPQVRRAERFRSRYYDNKGPNLVLNLTSEKSPLDRFTDRDGNININTLRQQINKQGVGKREQIFLNGMLLNLQYMRKERRQKSALSKANPTNVNSLDENLGFTPNDQKINLEQFKKYSNDNILEFDREFSPSMVRTNKWNNNRDRPGNEKYNYYGLNRLGYDEAAAYRVDKKGNAMQDEFDQGQKVIQDIQQKEINKRFTETENFNPSWDASHMRKINHKALEKDVRAYNNSQILENSTILLKRSAKGVPKIGGSRAHFFDPDVYGHIRYYVSGNDPDVFHIMELQSDLRKQYGKDKQFVDKVEKFKDELTNTEQVNSSKSILEIKNNIRYKKAQRNVKKEELKKTDDLLKKYNKFPSTWRQAQIMKERLEKYNELKDKRKALKKEIKELEKIGQEYMKPVTAILETREVNQEVAYIDKVYNRLITEAIDVASKKGMNKVRIPTGVTVANIEGHEGFESTLIPILKSFTDKGIKDGNKGLIYFSNAVQRVSELSKRYEKELVQTDRIVDELSTQTEESVNAGIKFLEGLENKNPKMILDIKKQYFRDIFPFVDKDAKETKEYLKNLEELNEYIITGRPLTDDILQKTVDSKHDMLDAYGISPEDSPQHFTKFADLEDIKKVFNNIDKYVDEINSDLVFYSNHPKSVSGVYEGTIKKAAEKEFKQKPKKVFDQHGNSWYEFDIPEKFKKGSPEVKAYQKGGELYADYLNYVNGDDESEKAMKAFDKLNAEFYNEAKENNMNPSNYIMTYIIPEA